jgi:acyl-coenzyme A thioesterase PaaI-like protein
MKENLKSAVEQKMAIAWMQERVKRIAQRGQKHLEIYDKWDKQKEPIMMIGKAFQDYYPDDYAHCYGCGRLNEGGLQLKSHWDGEESVCHFTPESYHTGGFTWSVYGGLIGSLMDCHAAATAAAARLREDGFSLGDQSLSRFVTASLKVDFLRPTPMGKVLELRGRVKEIKVRKVIVVITLSAEGKVCAQGEAVMVQLPESRAT